jgi:hypothetical protein
VTRTRTLALVAASLAVLLLAPLGVGAQSPVDNVTGTVQAVDDRAPLAAVRLVARDIGANEIDSATTASDGTYALTLLPGTYTLTATRVGIESQSISIDVGPGQQQVVDVEAVRVRAHASTGKSLPGGLVEATDSGIVLENEQLALAISTTVQDPQLAPATVGKPLDLARQGLTDLIDWINLPYVDTVDPATRGGQSFEQVDTVLAEAVEILEAGPEVAVVRSTATVTTVPDLTATTTYTIRPGTDHVEVETRFTNGAGVEARIFVGDVVDVDEAGQTGFVPGVGALLDGTVARHQPSHPWMGQAGTATAQAIAIDYTSVRAADMAVVGAQHYVQSVIPLSIPAGGDATLTRRLLVTPTPVGAVGRAERFADLATRLGDGDRDPGEEVGDATPTVAVTGAATTLAVGDATDLVVSVSNPDDEPLAEVAVELSLPWMLEAVGSGRAVLGTVPAGGTAIATLPVRAVSGGKERLAVDVTVAGARAATGTLRIFVDGPGWFQGDNHTHSTYSDGSGTIAQNMEAGRSVDLAWVTATDHNTIDQRAVLAAEARPDFLPLFGEEVTTGAANYYGHSLAYGIDCLVDWNQPPQQMLDQVNLQDGFLYIAHPFYPGLPWTAPADTQGITGVEVYNGFYPPRHPVNAQAFALWDQRNREGLHWFGIANSDGHNSGKIGDPRIRAHLTDLSQDAILAAMRTGHLYGTDGPELDVTVGGVRMGGDLITPGPATVDVVIRAGATPSSDELLTQVTLLRDGEVEQRWTPGSQHVEVTVPIDVAPGDVLRVEVDTAANRFAFSNPVWVLDAPFVPPTSSIERTLGSELPPPVADLLACAGR